MQYLKKKYSWFTLIEVLVSITIFSIIMVSVMMIFSSATGVSAKIDRNRAMQENVKNIIETISKDVTEVWLSWVSLQKWVADCNFDYTQGKYRIWDKLCLGDSIIWYEYFLARLSADGGSYNRVDSSEINTVCSDLQNKCVFVRLSNSTWITTKLSNSLVRFTDIAFYISKENIPKVTVNFVIEPALKKWVSYELIKNSRIIFETTLSERLVNTK